MNWDELKSTCPTWDNTSSLTWNLTVLDKYELIAKSENGSVQLPEEIKVKLYSLCTELAARVPEKKSVLASLNLRTVGDISKIAVDLTKIIQAVSDWNLWEKLVLIYESVISFLK